MSLMKRRASVALVASAALAALAGCGSDDAEAQPRADSATPSASANAPASPEPASEPPAAGGEAFRAGEYEATGSYITPDGQTQSVQVEVELSADGTIIDVDVDGQAQGGNSEQFQGRFESGIDAQVEGRKITELDVGHVSGSSLTSGGFNDAIDQIIALAQA